MTVLHVDLDNTLIYSYKHDIGDDKRNVELYHGREISFITNKTYDLLRDVNNRFLIVPTSTRTIEQYNRIDLKIGAIKYALVCNGGILLADGKRDENWYNETLSNISKSVPELKKAMALLEVEERRKFELRFIEDLFIFTKCSEPEAVVRDLKTMLDYRLVNVLNNGEKVYVIPVDLDKGGAVRRFRKRVNAEYAIAAGDSEFDISMVEAADKGFVPYGFKQRYNIDFNVDEMPGNKLFSEAFLEECLKMENEN